MNLPSASDRYDVRNENETRRSLEQEIDRLRAELQGIALANGKALLLRSPNGTKYKITVDNSGTLSVTAY